MTAALAMVAASMLATQGQSAATRDWILKELLEAKTDYLHSIPLDDAWLRGKDWPLAVAAFRSALSIRQAITGDWTDMRPVARKHLPNIMRVISELAPQLTELRIDVKSWSDDLQSLADGHGADIPYESRRNFPDTPENHWVYQVLVAAKEHGLNSPPDGFFRSGSRSPAKFDLVFVTLETYATIKDIASSGATRRDLATEARGISAVCKKFEGEFSELYITSEKVREDLAFIASAQKNDLGEARRSFGNSRNPLEKYHHNHSLEDGTTIVFPEGRADRRYMFPTIGVGGTGLFILCQSKVGKKVRDDWCVELVRGQFRRHYGGGTLESKLASNGYYLLKQVPQALTALRARKGFAAYKWNLNGFGYWFIPPDGEPDDYVEGYVKYVELKSSTELLPWTPFPYPISVMERKRIRNGLHDKLSN